MGLAAPTILVLTDSFDATINQLYVAGNRIFWQAGHAHDFTGQDNQESGACIDLDITHCDLKIPGPTMQQRVIR